MLAESTAAPRLYTAEEVQQIVNNAIADTLKTALAKQAQAVEIIHREKVKEARKARIAYKVKEFLVLSFPMLLMLVMITHYLYFGY